MNVDDLRLPPKDLDAEAGVIASVMLEPSRIDAVAQVLTSPDAFYSVQHQNLFTAIVAMHRENAAIDPVTLSHELARRDELESVGGVAYIGEIVATVPHASHAEYYAGIVKDHWVRRQVIYACGEIASKAYELPEVAELLSDLSSKAIDLQSDQTVGAVPLSEVIEDTLRRIAARRDGSDEGGELTGFRELDEIIGCMRNSNLIVVAARPSVGKSAFALQIGKNVAVAHKGEAKGGVLFVSLEMSNGEQGERLLAAEASVNSRVMLHGADDNEFRDLEQAGFELKPLPMWFLDNVYDGEGIASAARALYQRHGLNLIVCDYLQLCEMSGIPERDRERAVAKLSRMFKQLAKELNIPVIALSQLNRDVEKRQNKTPKLSDLRESGAIEQDANTILFLHRPDMYNPTDQPGVTEVIVAKNRGGEKGTASLQFVKEYTRFEDVNQYAGEFFAT